MQMDTRYRGRSKNLGRGALLMACLFPTVSVLFSIPKKSGGAAVL